MLRSPYGMNRPSVVCLPTLSSVCDDVAPYPEDWSFGKYFCTI